MSPLADGALDDDHTSRETVEHSLALACGPLCPLFPCALSLVPALRRHKIAEEQQHFLPTNSPLSLKIGLAGIRSIQYEDRRRLPVLCWVHSFHETCILFFDFKAPFFVFLSFRLHHPLELDPWKQLFFVPL